MFISLADFIGIWEREGGLTQRLLDALTDDSLKQPVSAEDRTLARLAWHIVTTIPEMMGKTGLLFQTLPEDAPVPGTARKIADSYRQVSQEMIASINKQWQDQALSETRDMYGETWTINATLDVLIYHQIHHRGQMTVLMRQAGLKVPGIYGPAREEWSAFGMEAPAI